MKDSSPKKHNLSKLYKYLTYGIFTLITLLTLYILFYNLGSAPLENWDEGWYADVTRNMLRSGDFIVLHWNNEVWFEKPPMFFWFSSFFSSIFGLSEFSFRITSAISGLIIILIVLYTSYRSYGLVPSLLAFSALALNNIFIWRSRTGNIDTLVTLFILLSYLLLLSKNKYKYPLLGLVFACIFLTKASLVLFPILVFVIFEAAFHYKDIKKNYLEYLKLLGVFFCVSGIWLLLGSLKEGSDLAIYYLFKSDQDAGRVSLNLFNTDYIYYAYYSLQRRFFFVLFIGTFFALINIRKPKEFLLIMFSFLLLIELSFSGKSNNWYLTPSMPFWSMLIAYGTYQVIKISKNNKILIALILLATLYVSYKTLVGNILPILNNNANYSQMKSSKEIKLLTQKNDTIIRLDHLYPSTIYYSDRKVLSSPEETTETRAHWIARSDLMKQIQNGNIKWLIGSKDNVIKFQEQAKDIDFKVRNINDEELILEVK